jgi:hypothetical protein
MRDEEGSMPGSEEHWRPVPRRAGATPAGRKRSAQKSLSPANGLTMDGTPARAAECEVPEPP